MPALPLMFALFAAPHVDALDARLDRARALVPSPRAARLRETRVVAAPGRRGGVLLETGEAFAHSVIVVIDDDGEAHAECLDGAPPDSHR